MEQIRIGNDIKFSIPLRLTGDAVRVLSDVVAWRVFVRESEKDLQMPEGIAFLNGVQHKPHHHTQMIELKVTGVNAVGELSAVWMATNNQRTGVYDVLVFAETASGSRGAADVQRVVEVCKHTPTGLTASGAEIKIEQTVEVKMLAVNFAGMSAYELAVSKGYVGTVEEWLQSLARPAVDAAARADEATRKSEAQTQLAKGATDAAKAAAADATRAKEQVQTATGNANTAAAAANAATATANAAASGANDAASSAEEAAREALVQADLSRSAAASANGATRDAIYATEQAQSVTADARRAADNANTSAHAAQTATAANEETNNAIKTAEQARVSAEQGRVSAEANRVTEENKRVLAEQNREEIFNRSETQRDTTFHSKEAQRDAAVEEATKVSAKVSELSTSLGRYDNVGEKSMTVKVQNKAVGVDGREFAKNGYAISDKIAVNRGDIIVFPSSQVLPVDVSFFNRAVTRTYNKIDHYEYEYDEEGNITKETPVFVEVTESFYEALSAQSVAAMPATGYVYLCPTTMEIVVCGLSADIANKKLSVYGLGIFKNIATNFAGAPSQRIIAQAFLQMQARIETLEALVGDMGNVRCRSLSVDDIPMVCNAPMILLGHGVPADGNVPDNWDSETMGEWNGCPLYIGQKYINLDAASNGEYYAVGTDAVGNWKQA